ncbi:MAG TPA: response regulator transcription factor [Candidatus Deferrimicrobiaceae bacterium]|jgi:DNA-binding NarL/FixJ family response regulator
MIRILLVEDQPLVREIVREILRDAPEMRVTGEAGDGDEMAVILAAGEFDLMLLDISLPGKSGFDLLKSVRVQYPGMAVLMLSTHSEPDYIARAIDLGAAGYVQKRHAAERLVDAIRGIRLKAAG